MPRFYLIGVVMTCSVVISCGNNESNNTNNTTADMNVDMLVDMSADQTVDQDPDLTDMPDNMLTNLPNQPGGNPLVPEVALYPFPSDYYLADDASTRTGKALALPSEAMPRGVPNTLFSTVDGFSRIPSILSYLPNSVDPASLPAESDVGASLKDDAPVMLVEADTWTRVPIIAEVDLNATDLTQRALIIRPMRTLKAKTTHVVILTNKLKDSSGKAHVAGDAFRALRDGIATDSPELEAQRDGFAIVNQSYEKVNLTPADVVLAWSFTTRSAESVTDPMRAIQKVAEEYTLPDDWTLTPQQGNDKNDQYTGEFSAPNFVNAEGFFELDEQGNPKQFGTRRVTFTLTVPKSITAPRPVIIFGHGFFSEKIEATRGSFNDLCHQEQFSAAAVDYEGFDEASAGTTIPLLTSDIGNVEKLIAKQMQAYTHFTVLARLVREKLSDSVTLGEPAIKPLDASKVHYMGISNGATFGAVIAASTKIFTRAVLVVGGGGLIHFLERAQTWNGLGVLFKRRYRNPLDLQLVLSLLQHKFDAIDSMNFVEHLVKDRLAGSVRVSMHMAVHDSSVANILTEMVARTSGVPMVVPSPVDIWGLETVSPQEAADLPGALVVYDEMLEPRPQGNVAPKEDNGAHESIRRLQVYKKNVAAFLNDGKLVQVCDGACDPD